MSTTRHLALTHMALSLAVFAAFALAAGPAAASTPTTADEVTSLSIERIMGDGRPPTTGPTNPAQHGV